MWFIWLGTPLNLSYMDNQNNGSFWPSYVDIMTTLFAITLVLFVVSFARFKMKETELSESNKILQTLVDEYENIITVYSTVSKIDSTRYFGYNEQYLKHLFTVDVEYQTKEFHIDKLKLDETDPAAANKVRRDIIDAGNLVKSTIQSIEANDSADSNIKFLVVIEGQSSKISFYESAWKNNYTLSYLRAQYLNEFWKKNGIDIDAIPRCELIISGSGEQGVPRNVPDVNTLRKTYPNQIEFQKAWSEIEMSNQRFLIHIVPVIGNIDVSKEKIDYLKRQR